MESWRGAPQLSSWFDGEAVNFPPVAATAAAAKVLRKNLLLDSDEFLFEFMSFKFLDELLIILLFNRS
jgi:hypothetical protein